MTAVAMKIENDMHWREQFMADYKGSYMQDEPLSKHTTLRIGGPADLMVFPANLDDLKQVILLCSQHKLPYMVLGAGSNVLVRDGGIRGLVISMESFREHELLEDTDDKAQVRVESGVSLPRLILWAAGKGLKGLEVLTGIPGSMGGVLRMNAGTRKGEVMELVRQVTYMDRGAKLRTRDKSQLEYGYRNLKIPSRAIIVEVVLNLDRAPAKQIRQAVKEGLDYRSSTQPVGQSAGCIFRNPAKESAGRLLDEAGLKGVRVRGARVSDKHANFILNERKASAKDVIALIKLMKARVKEKFQVKLETEISIVGED